MTEGANLLKIGEFAQLGNVSIRALRFYHEEGLLEPSHIDPATNYRSYEPRQLRDLQDIRLYKGMRFTLSEIRELLRRRPGPTECRQILRERRALLKQRIAEDVESLARIEVQLGSVAREDEQASWRVEMRETKPVWVASMRERMRSYQEADSLFAEIEHRIGEESLARKRAALWHTCANDGPQIDCEALRFLKHPVNPARGVRVYQLPAARVVSLIHSGTDETIPHAYQTLHAWLGRNDFVSRGPKCVIYWIEPPKGSEGESLTEIQLQVFPGGSHARRRAA